jgi:hypothetical protein
VSTATLPVFRDSPLLNTDSTSHTYVDFDKNLRHSSYKGETNTNLDNDQHNGSLPTKEAGERYRQLSRSSVLDPVQVSLFFMEYVFFYIIIMAKRTTYIDKLEN